VYRPTNTKRCSRSSIAGSAPADTPSGTGLGLAIAREIVRSHGGTIRVEDVVPHGARFVITLPSGGGHEASDKEDTA